MFGVRKFDVTLARNALINTKLTLSNQTCIIYQNLDKCSIFVQKKPSKIFIVHWNMKLMSFATNWEEKQTKTFDENLLQRNHKSIKNEKKKYCSSAKNHLKV